MPIKLSHLIRKIQHVQTKKKLKKYPLKQQILKMKKILRGFIINFREDGSYLNVTTVKSRVFIGIARLVSDPTGVLNHELDSTRSLINMIDFSAITMLAFYACILRLPLCVVDNNNPLKYNKGLLTHIYRDSPTSFRLNRSPYS
ncbi:unnamed protein product [Chrysodeixis includens]|uniref:Uncharacterized protein n=1 Tax=Chrysodeixis includens TaxID=689277 RepID=A0A9P0FSK3_CHRIL|nr:unnamed protein product [Chrysodeixis includens]